MKVRAFERYIPLSYHLFLTPLFCLFLSGLLRHVYCIPSKNDEFFPMHVSVHSLFNTFLESFFMALIMNNTLFTLNIQQDKPEPTVST